MNLSDHITDDLSNLRAEFVARGFDLRFVGGMVRDMLRGIDPKDKDFCTDANPDEQIEIYKAVGVAYYETGLQHGTISIRFDEEVFEITSLRTETDHDGRHATVAYTRDWLADLGRRDLTFNAMAMTFDGILIDPFNGADDLANNIVRFVGSPDERMKEDYLRILRWLRFHGRIANGKKLDPETVEAAKRNAAGLSGISRERVWMEVSKIIAGPNGTGMIESMYDLGLAEHIGLPKGCTPALRATRSRTQNPITLMASLLRDTGAGQMAGSWKWSAEERDLALFLDANRVDFSREVTPNDYHRMLAHDGQPRDWVIELAMLDVRKEDGLALADWPIPVFPVKGQDLIDRGAKPGKEMGVALKAMKAKWADSGYTLSKDELVADQ